MATASPTTGMDIRDPLEIYKSVRGLGADEFEGILERAIELLGQEDGSCGQLQRRGGVVRITSSSGQLVVIGDIHGDYDAIGSILAGPAPAALERGALVFLGDYVDRGPDQVEALAVVLSLKLEYPQSVVVLRGNHEPPPWLMPVPHDYPDVLASRFGDRSAALHGLSMDLFQRLPHAAVSGNGVFMVHGGPPSEPRRLDEIERPGREDLEDMLWGDPTPLPGSAPSPRGAGHLYGPDVTARFLSENGLSAIVRSHEPCDGYRIDHGGRVITVFSRRGPPYLNRAAGYFRADMSEPLGSPESHLFLLEFHPT